MTTTWPSDAAMLDVSDMNRREPTEMYAIDESKINRLSHTLCKHDSETKRRIFVIHR